MKLQKNIGICYKKPEDEKYNYFFKKPLQDIGLILKEDLKKDIYVIA